MTPAGLARTTRGLLLLAPILATVGACNKNRTEILIGLATDLKAPSPLNSVEMKIYNLEGSSDGAVVADQTLSISGVPNEIYELPGTFAVYSGSGGSDRFRAVLTATDEGGDTLVVRSAVMNLVPEKTLFVRLGTVSACQDMVGACGDGQTCVEGSCATENLDSTLLPEYKQGMESTVECFDGTNFVDTSTKQPLTITGTSCGAGTCLDGVCLAPSKNDGGAGAGGGGGSGGAGGRAGAGGAGADAGADGPGCSNAADPTSLPIDSTGFVSAACNSYGIQGTWYCSSDTTNTGVGTPPGNGSSNCADHAIPYDGQSNGMCISGVTSTSTGSYGAALGLQLNAPAPVNGVAPAGAAYNATAHDVVGFEVTIASVSGATNSVALRLTFTSGAATSVTQPFVDLPGPGTYDVLLADAVVPGDFSDTSANQRPNPASVYDVQLIVPPQGTNAVPYGYCITGLKPILAAPTTPGSCSALQAYGNPVCGAQDFLGEVGDYGVQNNLMGTGEQCIQARVGGNCAGFSLSYPTNNISGSTFPVAYPSIVYGWQNGSFYGAYKTARTLAAINNVLTTWSFNAPASATLWDASYDVWLGPNPTPQTPNGGLELLIWLNAGGVQPGGTIFKSEQTIGSIPGTWDIYRGSITSGAGSWQYLTYLADPVQTSFNNVDLKQFFNDAINESVGITTATYLLGVQAGFEVTGPSTGSVTSFSVKAN